MRTARGPRQRVVATIGKLPGPDASERAGWEHIAGLLDGKLRPADLFATPPEHDLGLRPIFHHTRDRTQAHILVCFRSLVLWRTLRYWMESSGLGTAPRKWLEELAEVRSLDVVLPTGAGTDLRLRTVSRPENHPAIVLDRLGLILPARAKRIGNVVEKIGPKIEKPQQMGNSIR